MRRPLLSACALTAVLVMLPTLRMLSQPNAGAESEPEARTAFAQAGLPAAPPGWPSVLHLGTSDGPGGAAAMKATAPYGYRSQYLAGGANTGNGWATWNPNGDFATYYIQDSKQYGMIPVFDYYQLLQSSPSTGADEGQRVYNNLQNVSTMRAYYADVKLFMQKAGAQSGTKVVFHFEPDLWGFMQQRAAGRGAASIPAQVAATGMSELAGLPNNLTGVARAATVLRDRYAPNVAVSYHISLWGTGTDITIADPADAQVDALADKESAFYASLGAPFDLLFYDPLDRDAAFYQYQYGDSRRWWDASDFRRNLRYLSRIVQSTQKRVILWQIPLGNTRMRAQNNTWNHYQDNRVEWWLDDPSRAHLDEWRLGGVIGFIFGRGADGPTCACDANNDGMTNPAPINGNTGVSLNADDDGGFFRQKAAAYYQAGAMPLAGGGTTAPPTPPVTDPCSPRPNVRVETARLGPGQIQVTLRPGLGNLTRLLRLGQVGRPPVNASVSVVGGPSGITGPSETPANGSQMVLIVTRRGSGPVTVPFSVSDSCGEWQSFIGFGAGV